MIQKLAQKVLQAKQTFYTDFNQLNGHIIKGKWEYKPDTNEYQYFWLKNNKHTTLMGVHTYEQALYYLTNNPFTITK